MKKVLLTGASGFIGTKVLFHLKNKKFNYLPLSYKNNSLMKNIDLSKGYEIKKLLDEFRPNIIINLAACVNFSYDLSKLYAINVECPKIFALYSKKNNCHLIHVSTVSIHGNKKLIINSSTQLNPLSEYAESKLLADQNIIKTKCNYTILRLGGVFGKNGPSHLMINKVIRNAINGEVPIISGSGIAKRNYIFVDDVARSIIKCIEDNITGVHYLGGETLSIKQMNNIICQLLFTDKRPLEIEGGDIQDQIIKNSPLFMYTKFKSAIESIIC